VVEIYGLKEVTHINKAFDDRVPRKRVPFGQLVEHKEGILPAAEGNVGLTSCDPRTGLKFVWRWPWTRTRTCSFLASERLRVDFKWRKRAL